MHMRRKMHFCQFWAYFSWLNVLIPQEKIENSKYHAKINIHRYIYICIYISHKYKLQEIEENKIWIDYLQH